MGMCGRHLALDRAPFWEQVIVEDADAMGQRLLWPSCRCQPSGRSTRTSTATAMRTEATIGFQRPTLMLHCSDAPTIQAVAVSASGTAATDNTATAAKRAGGCKTTTLWENALGKSPINEPSAPRASTPPDARRWEKRSLSSGFGRRHACGTPDPRGIIAIWVLCLDFATVTLTGLRVTSSDIARYMFVIGELNLVRYLLS